MIPRSSISILFLFTLLSGCGDSTNTEPKTTVDNKDRIKFSEVKFEDANLALCVKNANFQDTYTYIDELKGLNCSNRGMIPDDPRAIHSTAGIEQLTQLETLRFYNQKFTSLDVSAFKNLQTLTINETPVSTLDLSHNKNLVTLALRVYARDDITISSQLDLTNNPLLKSIEISNASYLKMPNTENLEHLELSVKANMSKAELDRFTGTNFSITDGRLNMDFERSSKLKTLFLFGQFNQVKLPKQSSLEHLSLRGLAPESIDHLETQKDLLAIDITLPASTEIFDALIFPKIQSISALGDGLKAVDLKALNGLSSLNIEGANIETILFGDNEQLEYLSLDTPKLESLILASAPMLNYFNFASGELRLLTIENSSSLTSLYIKNTRLKELSIPICDSLQQLSLGYSPELTKLDITSCHKLEHFNLTQSNIDKLDLTLNSNLMSIHTDSDVLSAKVPDRIQYEYKTVQQLIDSNEIPDKALAYCLKNYADQYANEVTELYCSQVDGKTTYAAIIDYIDPEPTGFYLMFSTKGLEHFVNLKYLDLSGHWLDKIDIGPSIELETLILDDNVIQNLDLSRFNLPHLKSLSINGNPLKTLAVPFSLQHLQANAIMDWSQYFYRSFTLEQKIDTPLLRDSINGEPLTFDHYSAPFELINKDSLYMLEKIESNKLTP